jgi:hypothetical protein
MLILLETIISCSLAFIIYYMLNLSSSFGTDIIATSVLVCGIIFLVTAFIFFLYYLVCKYCLEVKNKLISFGLRKHIPKYKNRKQVIPVDRYWSFICCNIQYIWKLSLSLCLLSFLSIYYWRWNYIIY